MSAFSTSPLTTPISIGVGDQAGLKRAGGLMVLPEPEAAGSKRRSVLLIIEKDSLRSFVARSLSPDRFSVTTCTNVRHALKKCFQESFDLILLDTALSAIDGLGVLLEVRGRIATPVILLADSEPDCIRSIEWGADDFLLKPFRPEDILVRSNALLRKRELNTGNPHTLRCEDLSLDIRSNQAWVKDRPLKLTGSEFSILKCLMRSLCRIVSRDEIALVLYQRQATPFERSIDVHVSHLRKKIEPNGRVLIRTVRGIGYLATPATGREQRAEP
jgi:two-component system response regulator CpxR